jgi:outer membrane protein assembly factor BamB
VADAAARPTTQPKTDRTAWTIAVPEGASSPCVVGDAIYLTGHEQGKLLTLCYDLKSGQERWRRPAPATTIEHYHAIHGSPAASTVAADAQRVVTYFGSCGLQCFDPAGAERWSHPLPCAETTNRFGSGCSPILAEGLVVLVRDTAKGSTLLALHADTGKVAWETSRDGFSTGWSTPVVRPSAEGPELVVAGSLRLKGYDLKTGREKWLLRNLSSVNCSSPIVDAGRVYFAGWSPGGEDGPMPSFAELAKGLDKNSDGAIERAEVAQHFLKDFFDAQDQDHDGKIVAEEWDGQMKFLRSGTNRLVALEPGAGDLTDTKKVLWSSTRALPYVPSPVVAEGKLFMVKDGGLASQFDVATGTPTYEGKRLGLKGTIYASPVVAGGHVYLATLDGVLGVLPWTGEPKLVSTLDLGEPIKATPAVVGNLLLVRTAKKMYAFTP